MLNNLKDARGPLGIFMRERRLACGDTQEQLAEKSGVPQELISSLECGTIRRASSQRLAALAEPLQCTRQDLESRNRPIRSRKRIRNWLACVLMEKSLQTGVPMEDIAHALGLADMGEWRKRVCFGSMHSLTYSQAVAVCGLLCMDVDSMRRYIIPEEQFLIETVGTEHLHSALRRARVESGRTQRQIADAVGVSVQCIKYVESGRYVPVEERLPRYSEVYRLDHSLVLDLARRDRRPTGGAGHRIKRRRYSKK